MFVAFTSATQPVLFEEEEEEGPVQMQLRA